MRTLGEALRVTAATTWHNTKALEHTYTRAAAVVERLGYNTPPRRITSAIIQKLTADLLEEGNAPSTVNRKLAALSTILKTAKRAGAMKQLPEFQLQPEPEPRSRTITSAELDRVCAYYEKHVGKEYAEFLRFLSETGMRPSEAIRVDWHDFDFDGPGTRRYVTLRGTKNKKVRRLPLTLLADELVRERVGYGGHGPWRVIDQNRLNYTWAKMVKALGITDAEFVPYGLRHTCASKLVKQGVPLPVVQQWLGHKNIQTTMRYVHVDGDQLAAAVAAFEKSANAPTAVPA